jgi:hypothetical protein
MISWQNPSGHFTGEFILLGFLVRMVMSMFLDQEGRRALARRAYVSKLEDELKVEMAKTNALVKAMNSQADQSLGISDKRQAEIQTAMVNQAKAQEALNELDLETRQRMLESALDKPGVDEVAPPANGSGDYQPEMVVAASDTDDEELFGDNKS